MLPKETNSLKQRLSSKQQEIEIIVQKPKSKGRYIKELNQLKKLNQKIKKQAALLSKTQKRFKKETVARLSGKTQNAQARPQRPSQNFRDLSRPKPKISLSDIQKRSNKRTGGFKISKKTRKALKNPGRGHRSKLVSPSSFSQHIPGVQAADMTALNTDEGSLKYYIFNTRMQDQIRPRWIALFKSALSQLPPAQVLKLSRKDQVTKVQFILDKDGNYVGSLIIKKSESIHLDQVAVQAFKAAAPYVNPPEGMVEEDDLIYIPFSFRVALNPNYFARKR